MVVENLLGSVRKTDPRTCPELCIVPHLKTLAIPVHIKHKWADTEVFKGAKIELNFTSFTSKAFRYGGVKF